MKKYYIPTLDAVEVTLSAAICSNPGGTGGTGGSSQPGQTPAPLRQGPNW